MHPRGKTTLVRKKREDLEFRKHCLLVELREVNAALKAMVKRRRRVVADDIDLMRQMYRDGERLEAISKVTGRKPSVISYHAQRGGLKMRGRGGKFQYLRRNQSAGIP